ncbi:hypothetical protein Taro_016466 [Colocasia esculenta]|uniref:Retrotransposon gag domain-containing protein n=1 Tax=Colocasia esculenta TaxID=4460 RepID=A0A843UKF3_COLES|nr:hypothetical protein [Colocasia esculenta]
MRSPPVDRVVLATYQLWDFAQEWWRIVETMTWLEFLEAFNDTFFPIQVQQGKREQFQTLQQGNSSVLKY